MPSRLIYIGPRDNYQRDGYLFSRIPIRDISDKYRDFSIFRLVGK